MDTQYHGHLNILRASRCLAQREESLLSPGGIIQSVIIFVNNLHAGRDVAQGGVVEALQTLLQPVPAPFIPC